MERTHFLSEFGRFGPYSNVMQGEDLVIIGAGGFGREVLTVIRSLNELEPKWRFAGFIADDPPSEPVLSRIDAEWLGSVEDAIETMMPMKYVIGIGSPDVRRKIAARLDAAGWQAVALVHPSAQIGEDVEISMGSVICGQVSLTTNIRIGKHVHINPNSTVGHDCVIGDFVSINPLVSVSGDVELESGVTMGTHSSILQGLRVGKDSIVGAGALVVKNVAPNTTVVGIPAKPLV